jgi:glycine/D-amino acid oxidase-like deaminating enzyme
MTAGSFDVAVVGGGMLGASVAYHLMRAGRRVVVLDAGAGAGRATDNSFAWLNAVSKEPEAYHRLNAAGMAEYERLAAELDGLAVHRTGCVEWMAGTHDESQLDKKVARLQARGYAARWITPAELAALEPGLRPGDAARIAFYERDAWVDAPSVARAMLDAVCAAGGEVRNGWQVSAIQHGGKHAAAVESDAGVVTAGDVVLCAGTGTGALARRLGAEVPVENRPGLLAVTTEVPAGALGRVVYAPGVHMRPDTGGGLRLGADDVDEMAKEHFAAAPPEPVPPPPWASVLLDRARMVLPALADTELAHVRIGVRPVPADGHTVCGRLPEWGNVYVAVTHSGITLGPLLGRLLTEEIVSGARDPLLADFRPERFAVAP